MRTRGTLSRLMLASAAALVPLAAGCQAGGHAKPGEEHFSGSTLVVTETVSLEKAFAATASAINELKIRPVGQSNDAFQAHFEADTIDHEPVYVDLTSIGFGVTEFQIRAGVFGDKPMAQAIMTQIRKGF